MSDPAYCWARQRFPFTRRGTFTTILGRLHVIRHLAVGLLLILPATSGAQQAGDPPTIAYAPGDW